MPFLLVPALGALGVSAAVAGPLSSILFTGISFALSVIFAPKVPKPEAGRVPFKQTVPPRIRIIGRRRSAGAYMLYHASGGRFFGVGALCEGRVNAFTRHYLHDDVIIFQPDGYTVDSTIQDGRYGSNQIRLYTRLGLPTETAYEAAVAELPSIWTEFHRGDGIASYLLDTDDGSREDHSRNFPFGLPQPSMEIDATQVYDPRDDAQLWDTPSTWSGTGNDNPILAAMWYLTASIREGGMGLDFEEAFLPVLSEVVAQANICDEDVPLKIGNPEKRYRSGVLYKFEDDPGDVLAAILGTCDGFCAERGDGTFILKAGKWDDDDFSVVIEDEDIISLRVQRFKPDEDEVTGVIVKYNSVVHEHTAVDAPVWPRDAYQGGNDRRIRPIEVTYCPSGTQAQRISKRVAIYEMSPVSGTMTLKMVGIQLLEKRGATIQCTDDPALADAKVRLTRVEPNFMQGTVEIDFTVFDPVECDAWDAATEQGILQPVVDVPTNDGFPTPSSLIGSASQIASVIFVDIGFNPGDNAGENTEYAYRWRIADIGSGVPGGWTSGNFDAEAVQRPTVDTFWIVTFNHMPEGYLEFQLRAHQNDYSDKWSQSGFVDTSIAAPGRVNNLTVELSGADVLLKWNAPNSVNMDHALVYRATSGTAFDLADVISGNEPGTRNDYMTYIDIAPASGNWDYWIVAATIADVASLPRGPVTITVP